MVITIPDGTNTLDLQNVERLGVQLSFDETSYRLMMEDFKKDWDNNLYRDLFNY